MDKNIYGYDSTNNKNVRLTSSSNGKVNVKNIEKTLKQYRREGKCFYASIANYINVTENYLLTLWNPSGSGHKVGLYNVQWNTSTDETTGDTVKYTLHTIDGITFGTNVILVDRKNVKLGQPDDTDIGVHESIHGSTDFHGTLMSSYLIPSSSSGGLWQYLDFQEEIVEIPEGYGVTMRMHDNTSSLTLQYGVTFRYIKVPNTEEL